MNNKKLLLTVFLISTSLFMYEITLTRLFSTVMWYHFVFLAISLAILSIGLGGIVVYKLKTTQENYYGFTKDNILKRSSLLLGLSTLLVTIVIYKTPFYGLNLFVYAAIGSIPFI